MQNHVHARQVVGGTVHLLTVNHIDIFDFDKGLANSKVGLVLVTPALLSRLPKEGVADKELSTLLAGNRLIPIVHNTTYEALRDVSPMLASRSGLDTSEDTLEIVAEKIAELVAI